MERKAIWGTIEKKIKSGKKYPCHPHPPTLMVHPLGTNPFFLTREGVCFFKEKILAQALNKIPAWLAIDKISAHGWAIPDD